MSEIAGFNAKVIFNLMFLTKIRCTFLKHKNAINFFFLFFYQNLKKPLKDTFEKMSSKSDNFLIQ